MIEPRWISEKVVRALHAKLICEHGGEPGVLNLGQLLSTVAKPRNLFAYGDNPTLFELAAAYGYGFVKNHCFVDGNKRVAVVAIDVFLQLNGYELIAEESEVVLFIQELAASLNPSEKDQEGLALWIKKHSNQVNPLPEGSERSEEG